MLGAAASDRADSELVVPLVAFAALQALPVVLALTAYLSVLLALTRAWKDSEMVVWMSSGLSLGQWLRPVARFVWPFALAMVALTFFCLPPGPSSSSMRPALNSASARKTSGLMPAVLWNRARGRLYFSGKWPLTPKKGLVLSSFVRSPQAKSRSSSPPKEKSNHKRRAEAPGFLLSREPDLTSILWI
jgi:Predicted permeases